MFVALFVVLSSYFLVSSSLSSFSLHLFAHSTQQQKAGLVRECGICLTWNKELMSRKNNSKELEKTGKDIYRNKPTFKRTRDSKEFGDAQFVTWSQEEYANLGLQRQYLKLKSYQRFTEAWSLLERADARGLCFLFLILDDYYFICMRRH